MNLKRISLRGGQSADVLIQIGKAIDIGAAKAELEIDPDSSFMWVASAYFEDDDDEPPEVSA